MPESPRETPAAATSGSVKADDSASPEMSLQQLSDAYAEVLKQQEAVGEPASGTETDGNTAAEVPPPRPERNVRKDRPRSLEQIDADDNAPCQISPASIVEAILFTGAPSGATLTARKIAAAMRDVSPEEVCRSVEALNRHYEEQNHPFRIVEQDGQFRMQLVDAMDEVQSEYFGRNRAARLSQSVIDVLAIVAYHQPISRAEVDRIRSRPSGNVLKQLVKRDLIIADESESDPKTPGSAQRNYRTTDRFLQLFGLQSLKDLPQTSVVSDLEELADQ